MPPGHAPPPVNGYSDDRIGITCTRAEISDGVTDRAQAHFRLDLVALSELYRSGAAKPTEMVRLTYRRIAADASNPIWIARRPHDEVLEDARRQLGRRVVVAKSHAARRRARTDRRNCILIWSCDYSQADRSSRNRRRMRFDRRRL